MSASHGRRVVRLIEAFDLDIAALVTVEHGYESGPAVGTIETRQALSDWAARQVVRW
jgi:hypothetical protein